jgi:hypothetical protein
VERTIFEVEPAGKGWVLRHQGTGAEQMFATRDAAIASGREACQANLPSRLRVRRTQDEGTQD